MQLIVGCLAWGASWAGSETLVIPGKRLTIHVHAHGHARIYRFRIRVRTRVYRVVHFALNFTDNYSATRRERNGIGAF